MQAGGSGGHTGHNRPLATGPGRTGLGWPGRDRTALFPPHSIRYLLSPSSIPRQRPQGGSCPSDWQLGPFRVIGKLGPSRCDPVGRISLLAFFVFEDPPFDHYLAAHRWTTI